MNNLTTRKIVLGMLMVLVLAFSVQGTAEAISGILGTNTIDETDIRQINSAESLGINVALDGAETKESVRITVSSGVQLITPVPLSVGADLTLTEGDTDGDGSETKENGQFVYSGDGIGTSLSINVRFTKTGEQTVKIEDKTGTYKGDDTAPVSLSTTYVYYVETNADTRDTTVSLDGVKLTPFARGSKSGYDTRSFGEYPRLIHKGDKNNYKVNYIVIGGGEVYVQDSASTKDSITVAGTTVNGTNVLDTFSGFDVYLDENGDSTDGDLGSTNVVTAMVDGSTAKVIGVYVHGTPTLAIDITDANDNNDNLVKDAAQDEYKFINGDAGEDAGTIQVTVTDEKGASSFVNGVIVKFELVNKINRGGYLTIDGQSVTDINRLTTTESASLGQTLYVLTDLGEATVNYRFGTLGKQTIRVSSVGINREVIAELASVAPSNELEITGTRRSEDTDVYDLTVEIKDPDGETHLSNEVVTFRTDNGELNAVPVDPDESGRIIEVTTNTLGKAHAVYDLQGNTGRQEIHASIGSSTRFQEETFVINGSARRDPPLVRRVARLSIRVDGTGTTRAVTVTATNAQGVNIPGLRVALTGTALTTSRVVNTETATVITLPTTPDDYTIIATLSGYDPDTETLTVAASAALGTFSITTIDAPVNGQQTIEVTVLNANGARASVPVTVTLVGPGISRTVETTRGTGRVFIRIPTTTTSYTLTVSADGYRTKQETFTTTGQRAEAPAPPSGPAGEADSVEIDGSRTRSGTVNEELDAPLRVRVVDANDNGVEDVRVVFRVLSPGRGTFPGARGSGRATQDDTDQNGYVSVDFTPISTGNVTVRATPAGGIAPVTFIIDVGEAADDDDPEPPTPSRDVGPSREINPVVHLGMASRPPMLWVDGGAIYALVGADAQRFAPSVDNAMNITVGGGKVYWTEKGESGGTVNSANLNGSDVKELASIFATPIGIAVDTAGSKLYWTNSRGRIQSADLDGSGITNVIPGGLESPMDLALAGSNLYWTQGNGSVRVVNLRGQQVVRNVSTGTDTPGSVVVGGNKVYWTEMTGDSSGTVNSANLNGTDVKELKSIQAVPMGIAVDGSRSKLYWTNSRGRIQSANLDGSGITNVVSGLGSPGDMVLSNSITAPAAAPAETASGSKYDVNGDGTVDNADSDAVTVAIAAGATDAKYDVNGDGTVNVFDLVEIIANRDPGAAGAPTLFGMKMSAAQIDSLQEQIDLLIATNDRSPAAMRTLIYLQQLLVTARPEKTLLLANYPNPFNPETWIPYELATDTNVKVTIYNTQGVVIRSLQLGHQSAGYYVGRDRAAYWDGRNALGEQVASGLYFYQLETDAMSLMRKMVILK